MKIRLCFLIRRMDEGGAQRQLLELARNLDPERFDVTVIAFYPGGIFSERLASLPGIAFRCVGKGGRWDLAGFAIRLARLIRMADPDLLHPYMTFPNIMAVLLGPLVPRARIVWGVRSADAFSRGERGLAGWLYRLECVLARHADRIIVNSDMALRAHARHGFPLNRMISIPNGIDLSRFRPDPAAGAAMRARWGFAREHLVIGCVGRLNPIKGYPVFLKAAADFAARHPEARFACVGGGPEGYRAELQALARALGLEGKVAWTGAIADVPSALRALDIFTLASLSESFPNSVCEAMACELACVATDVGDAARIVGPEGAIVPPGDPAAMAGAWEALAGVDRTALGRRARARVEGHFSVEALATRTAGELEALAGPNALAAKGAQPCAA
jgi:glycosyltransferase involved in cell wall biosynthesis